MEFDLKWVHMARYKLMSKLNGALPGNFLRGPEKCKKSSMFAYFPWWANGPYSTALGSMMLTVSCMRQECILSDIWDFEDPAWDMHPYQGG